MRKKIIKRILLGTIIIGLLSTYTINLILNVLSVEEVNQELDKIQAQADSISGSLSTGSRGGHSRASTLKGGSISGANVSHQYSYMSDSFCGGHGWTIARRKVYSAGGEIIVDRGGAGRQQETTYTYDKTTEMAQSIAYARWFGASNEYLQNIIWGSGQWSQFTNGCCLDPNSQTVTLSTTSAGLQGRSYKFANFIYNGLQNQGNGDLGLYESSDSGNENNLRIMVDQNANTYTVGPYSISFPNQGTAQQYGNGNIGQLLWDEIVHNYEGKFAAGLIDATVTFQDGSQDVNTYIDVVDANGNVISEHFPRFGETFYVRYHSSKDGKIVERIKPRIEIEYIKKITKDGSSVAECYTYKANHLHYNMLHDYGNVMLDSLNTVDTENWGNDMGTMSRLGGLHIYRYPTGNLGYGFYFENNGIVNHVGNGGTYNSASLNYSVDMVLKAYLGLSFANLGFTNGWLYNKANVTIDWGYHGGLFKGTQFYEDATVTFHTNYTGPFHHCTYHDPVIDEETGDVIEEGYETHENCYYNCNAWATSNYGALDVPTYTVRVSYEDGNTNQGMEDALEYIYMITDGYHYAVSIEDYLYVDEDNYKCQPTIQLSPIKVDSVLTTFYSLGSKDINMYIGGNVWEDMPTGKIGEYTGRRTDTSISMSGIQVELWDNYHNRLVARTLTDSNGKYGFQKINPLLKYRVVFTYDGMRFENTRYTNNLSGSYSTAKELVDENGNQTYQESAMRSLNQTGLNRAQFNDYFDKIETSPQNYYKDGEWRKAYGLYSKLEDKDGNYIRYNNTGTNEGAFRYYDALEIFRQLSINTHPFNSNRESDMINTYYRVGTGMNNGYYQTVNYGYDDIKTAFINRLIRRWNEVSGNTVQWPYLGMSEEEANNVWKYINDTMIKSSTLPYPEQDRFTLEDVDGLNSGSVIGYEHLYVRNRDQSRNVDFGMKLRTNADLYLAKDLYKATLLVNGKQQEYYYNKKKSETDAEGSWIINLSTGTYEYKAGITQDENGNFYRTNADGTKTRITLNQNQNIAQALANDPQTSESSERAKSEDYIGEDSGGNTYTREVRKSEYLYDGSDVGSTDAKNLQVFVTYRIAVKNQTQDIWTSVDEIVDYYDSTQYYSIVDMRNGIIPESRIIVNNTYIGDSSGNKIYDLNVSDKSAYVSKYRDPRQQNSTGNMDIYYNGLTENGTNRTLVKASDNINDEKDYKTLYLTGLRSVEEDNMGETRLMPGEITYAYITFKVQNDPDTGKVKIDQKMEDLLSGNIKDDTDLVGKRNIAEINGYSTYFHTMGTTKWTKAGVIDLDSNAGSLKPRDLNDKGDIISSVNSWENRLEDDEDKANNIKLKINTDAEEERSISGYTFEDARTLVSDGAVIGNGKYNEGDKDFEENADKRINGLTVELVEMVKQVDSEGFPTGNYEKEYIWKRVLYTKDGNVWNQNIDNTRYYSGTEAGQVILQGQGIFAVSPSALNKDAGEYKFDSVPPGDFFVRFIYGDTTQTVLTNIQETGEGYTDSYTDKYGNKDEVQELFNKLTDEEKNNFVQGANEGISIKGANEENGSNIPAYQRILGTSGLNSKSYTGQDYKSTIYQSGVNQNPEISNYNGIIGYTNTGLQNYNRTDVNDKNSMYYYNIYQSDKNTSNGAGGQIGEGISDAKDVYSYRMDERNYSLGSTSNLEGDVQTLKNHRAEVLASGTKLVTKAAKNDEKNMLINAVETQRDAIKELIENTTMVSQTGIINMEVEYNRQQTNVYNGDTKEYVQNLVYKLEDLDLGLTERPEAQLQVTKELTNVQIKLANGSILFDANQSVPNLLYGEHKIYGKDEYYHNVGTNDNPGYRLRHDIQNTIKNRQEELVLATMDEEIMSGATVRLTYKISVDNIGEVDYLDTDFYYIGKTNNINWDNVSRTNALNVLDYVTNEMNFEVNYQNDTNDWKIVTRDSLLGTDQDTANELSGNYSEEILNRLKEDNDYVNSYYKENLDTYNVLIRSEKLSGNLIPRALDNDLENFINSRREVNLILSTLLSNTFENKNVIYTNLAEIIETSNSWGRRMELSKTGDEEVPYQSAEDKSIDESTFWVKPKGPDADSGQKVQILAPTGENKNYQRVAVLIISALGLIIAGVVIIKNKVLKNNNA